MLRRKVTSRTGEQPDADNLRWIGRVADGSATGRRYTYRKLDTNLVVSGSYFGANRSCKACNSIKMLAFLIVAERRG
jgi:hypothetical protein